jgi:hypothetical protein
LRLVGRLQGKKCIVIRNALPLAARVGCSGRGTENSSQSRPFLPPFHKYMASYGLLHKFEDIVVSRSKSTTIYHLLEQCVTHVSSNRKNTSSERGDLPNWDLQQSFAHPDTLCEFPLSSFVNLGLGTCGWLCTAAGRYVSNPP